MTELPGSFVSEQLIRPDLLEMTYWLTSLGKYLLEGSQYAVSRSVYGAKENKTAW